MEWGRPASSRPWAVRSSSWYALFTWVEPAGVGRVGVEDLVGRAVTKALMPGASSGGWSRGTKL